MFIKKILLRLFVCIVGICLSCSVFAATNNLGVGEITEFGNWLNPHNIQAFKDNISADFEKFKPNIDVESDGFIPIEAKLGLMFMKVLSGMDYVLQSSLVRFTILFMLVMYAFWIGLEAYKMIKGDSKDDYKKVLYTIFKKGIVIAIWILILDYGPSKIFVEIVSPILAAGTYLSQFILKEVAENYDVKIQDTCAAIHTYVKQNGLTTTILDENTAANIMCLPARLSVYFYDAVKTGFTWISSGLHGSASMVIVGIISVYVFFKCIFKYAFLTLGIVADLFFTLLMLPFTALAEALPETSEKGYLGKIFSGFLKMFNTKKLSAVLAVFINAAVYFVSLSIIIAICAALMANIVYINKDIGYSVASGLTIILTGFLILHLTNQAEKLAKDIGGSVDNTVGNKLEADVKDRWEYTKKLSSDLAKKIINKKAD